MGSFVQMHVATIDSFVCVWWMNQMGGGNKYAKPRATTIDCLSIKT